MEIINLAIGVLFLLSSDNFVKDLLNSLDFIILTVSFEFEPVYLSVNVSCQINCQWNQ